MLKFNAIKNDCVKKVIFSRDDENTNILFTVKFSKMFRGFFFRLL